MQADWYVIKPLILKYFKKEITDNEKAVLNEWLKDQNNQLFFDEMTNDDALAKKISKYYLYKADTDKYKQREIEKLSVEGKFFNMPRINWLRYVAAASVFLLLAISAYLWVTRDRQEKNMASQEQTVKPIDVPPGHDGAILTLANGEQIILDSAANGLLTQQGNSKVVKSDGTLAYTPSTGGTQAEVVYNTLTTPRGRQFQLELPDGSKIWLNAASSVTFPNLFAGKERRIEVSGEVYLEVTKDAAKPFVVAGAGAEVEVLGTAFNINSYPEESGIKTTLIEGSVRIRKDDKSVTIRPGQQAEVTHDPIAIRSRLTTHDNIDLDAVLAWKNGLIVFNDVDIKVIMRQISRWYDVEVEFAGDVEVNEFTGDIPRTLPLSQVLKALRLSSELNITLENKTVTVSK